jgi:hypothetical protein
MGLFLTVVSGLAWTIVYVEGIRVGFRDKSYAVPIAALALNFAWEATYTVEGLRAPLTAQTVVNLIWALADIVIVYTYFRFGRGELPAEVTRTMFVAWSALLFAASFAVQWLFIAEFGVNDAVRYSAFFQNLLMSGLFIAMLIARRGLRGQSVTIAVAKWIGTLAPTILFGALDRSVLVLGIGILCSLFDLLYVWMTVWARNSLVKVGLTARQLRSVA